jgi:hypothetical protein
VGNDLVAHVGPSTTLKDDIHAAPEPSGDHNFEPLFISQHYDEIGMLHER